MDTFTTNDRIIDHAHSNSSTNQRPSTNRRGSVLERLGNGLGNLVHCHHDHPTKPEVSSDDPDIIRQEAMSIVPEPAMVSKTDLDTVFHIVLTGSHFHKDVNPVVQAVRICGTYTSPNTATVLAHRCLSDAGYEVDRFATLTSRERNDRAEHEDEFVVRATGLDGDVFIVSVESGANFFKLRPEFTQTIEKLFFHVVETIVHYFED